MTTVGTIKVGIDPPINIPALADCNDMAPTVELGVVEVVAVLETPRALNTWLATSAEAVALGAKSEEASKIIADLDVANTFIREEERWGIFQYHTRRYWPTLRFHFVLYQ